LGELSFIREAGVAGDGMPGSNTWPGMWCAWFWGAKKGDGLADLGFGIGGGGMSINVLSWSASGDTELL
jgi:hypothetical protein